MIRLGEPSIYILNALEADGEFQKVKPGHLFLFTRGNSVVVRAVVVVRRACRSVVADAGVQQFPVRGKNINDCMRQRDKTCVHLI